MNEPDLDGTIPPLQATPSARLQPHSPLPDFPPAVMLDAGGEPWMRIRGLVSRRVDELSPGEVLELLTQRRGIRRPLREWCRGNGHELSHTRIDEEHSAFRIRKA